MYEDIYIEGSVRKQFDLKNKVAIITGGGGFLGVQFAESIAEMGGKPILIDVNQESLNNASDRLVNAGFSDFSTYIADLTDENSIIDLKDQLLNDCKSLDILINSAALTHSGMENSDNFFNSFEETDSNVWEAGINVNLTSLQLICKVLGSKMVELGNGGSIINIASDVGVISPNPNIYESDDLGYDGVDFNSPAFYAVSKAGVIHLTKFLAVHWAKNNVRVNCISPAGVYKNQDPGFIKKLTEQIPMGRMALPNEFKGAIIFLASNASSFITGHNLLIDGGRTIW
jgi:NAD(P)-dependent dehydrogenase (short-subunit alcohol dehydrogenase family)